MIQAALPFDICARRHRGNPESAAANPSRGTKAETRLLVLEQLRRNGPMTSKELAAAMGTRINCISGRLSELAVAGEIERTDARRDGCAVLRVR